MCIFKKINLLHVYRLCNMYMYLQKICWPLNKSFKKQLHVLDLCTRSSTSYDKLTMLTTLVFYSIETCESKIILDQYSWFMPNIMNTITIPIVIYQFLIRKSLLNEICVQYKKETMNCKITKLKRIGICNDHRTNKISDPCTCVCT